jgi:hypothetical protein
VAERAGAVAVEALEVPAAVGSAATRARRGYFAIALSIAAIVAWGFWGTYYSQIAARTDLPSIVHLHAAVFSIWVRCSICCSGWRRSSR